MKLEDIIRMVSARLATLNSARSTAAALGDIDRVIELDAQIDDTQDTLNKLQAL